MTNPLLHHRVLTRCQELVDNSEHSDECPQHFETSYDGDCDCGYEEHTAMFIKLRQALFRSLEAIEAAPHGVCCGQIYVGAAENPSFVDAGKGCDCWKATAQADIARILDGAVE